MVKDFSIYSRSGPFAAAIRAATILLLLAAAVPLRAQGELRLQVARQWAEKGEYEKAVQELRLYLNEHPDAADVYARIGTLRLRQGKLQSAADHFKMALSKDPNLGEARQGLARVKEQEAGQALPAAPGGEAGSGTRPKLGKTAGSSGDYSPEEEDAGEGGSGIYSDPDYLEARRFYRQGKPDEALVAVRKTLGRHPGHPGAYYLGGVIRYEKGELGKAAYNFKRSFDYPERGFNAHFYLGRIHQKQGRVAEAIDAFGNYLKATRSEAGRKQAEAYLAQLMPQAGKSDDPGLPAAVAKDGKSAPVPARAEAPMQPEEPGGKDSAHGQDHGKTGGHVASHATGTDTAGAHAGGEVHGMAAKGTATPSVPVPLVLAGEGTLPFVVADSNGAPGRRLIEAFESFKKEKYERAADNLKEVIRLYGGSPNAEAAELDLASVYIRLGLWDNARDRILGYLSRAKDPSRFRDLAFYLEGLMHLGTGDGAKAERALLKVKPGSYGGPSREELDYCLAEAGALMKDLKKWSSYLEQALKSAAGPLRKAELEQRLGLMHGKHGRPERALDHLRRSMDICGKGGKGGDRREDGEGTAAAADTVAALCAGSQLRIADLEFRRRRWKEALAGYGKFSEAWPDHKEAAWARYQMANAHQAMRNLEQALNEYKRVIDNYPESYWAAQARWKREDAIWRKEYEEVLD
jgi:tetratricopeptide (TPR) repeat protein